MDVKTVLEELKTAGISWHDLIDVTERTVKRQYKQKYGIYPEDRELDKYNIVTIESEINRIHKKHIAVFGDMGTAKTFYEFKGLRFSLESIDDKTVNFHRWSQSSNAEIIHLVRYAIFGAFDEDYKEVNNLLDNHDPRINYNSMMWELSINLTGENAKTWDIKQVVTVKSFKNGKIKITGLTAEQKDRIKAGFDIVEKYRNIH